MGRDNHPKDRQQRRQLERKTGQRAPYDRILIVTEGKKTEPNYFEEIRSYCRLHSTNIEITPSTGTSPLQVVDRAHELFIYGDSNKNIQKRAFECVYAVFDRDEHPSYIAAIERAGSLNGKLKSDSKELIIFRAIASVPSFELWLLLHFENILAPIHRDAALQRLMKHLPDYTKGADDIFAKTRSKLSDATQRSLKLSSVSADICKSEGPCTDVAVLVNQLINLKGNNTCCP